MKQNQKIIKSEETKTKIFEAALTLFREKGFQETTMREIAAAAGVSLGSSYYYYQSKDDIVHHFYEATTKKVEDLMPSRIIATKDFSTRFLSYIENQFELFLPYKKMIVVLVRNGVDPDYINSPFNSTTVNLRTRSIKIIDDCIRDSNLKFDSNLRTHILILFWFYMMGILFFWTFDKSENYSRTRLLMSASLKLVINLLNLGRLPVINKIQNSLIALLEEIWASKKIFNVEVISEK